MFSKPYSALLSQKVVLHEPDSFVCEYLFNVLHWINYFVTRPFYWTPNHPLNDRVNHAHTPVSNPIYWVALKRIMYQHIHSCTVCITSVTWNNCDIFTALFSLLYFKLNEKQAKLSTIHYFCTNHDYVHYWIRRTRTKLENALMKMSEAQSYWCWQWVEVGRVWFMNPTSKSAANIICADSPECCSAYVALHLMTYCFALCLSGTHRPHVPSGKYVKPQELITVMTD